MKKASAYLKEYRPITCRAADKNQYWNSKTGVTAVYSSTPM